MEVDHQEEGWKLAVRRGRFGCACVSALKQVLRAEYYDAVNFFDTFEKR